MTAEHIEYWNGKRVFLTGATGFLGAHLLTWLKKAGAEMSVLMRSRSSRFRVDGLLDGVSIYEGDLTDADAVKRAISAAAPEYVFHFGAAGVSTPIGATPLGGDALFAANATGTLNICNASLDAAVKRFVYAGSCGEYGDGVQITEDTVPSPSNLYCASKNAGHVIAHALRQAKGLPVLSVRPFATYGPAAPTARLVSYAIISALQGSDIELRSSKQKRDYVYIDDVVDGILHLASLESTVGGTFNLCSGVGRSAEEVVETILDMLGHPVKFHPGAVPLRPGEMNFQSGSYELARKTIGWQPRTDLKEGLRKTIGWYRENLHLSKDLAEA